MALKPHAAKQVAQQNIFIQDSEIQCNQCPKDEYPSKNTSLGKKMINYSFLGVFLLFKYIIKLYYIDDDIMKCNEQVYA